MLSGMSSDAKALFVRSVKPPTSGVWWDIDMARECQAGVPQPTEAPIMVLLDLQDVHPTAEALEACILPLAQGVKGGRFPESVIVVATLNPSVRRVVGWMASNFELPMFVSNSTAHIDLASAEPVGNLSATERETLETVAELGGRVSARQLADQQDPALGYTAAFMRLATLAKKGYLRRERQSGKRGELFTDPRMLGQRQFVETFVSAASDAFGAGDWQDVEQALVPANGTSLEPASY